MSPDEVSEDQLRGFLLHLKNERKFAYGSMRVAFSGIKSFYTRTCKRQWETLQTIVVTNGAGDVLFENALDQHALDYLDSG